MSGIVSRPNSQEYRENYWKVFGCWHCRASKGENTQAVDLYGCRFCEREYKHAEEASVHKLFSEAIGD